MEDVDLKTARARALKVKRRYDELNQIKRGRTWTNEEFMLGFVGDVGDLAKLVMAQEGARDAPGGIEALGHELADCFWSVLILADVYGVDLGTEFERIGRTTFTRRSSTRIPVSWSQMARKVSWCLPR